MTYFLTSFNKKLARIFYKRYLHKMEDQSKKMKCIMLIGPEKVEVQSVPIPQPKSGEVLIKVMAAPINPSDLAFLGGHYIDKKLPAIPGFEGSGIVMESGGGIMGWSLTGKRVAFSVQGQYGSYGQYAIVPSGTCLPLDQGVSFEQGCMSFVNPLTVLAFVDKLKSGGHKSVIHTAAASQLGRMLVRVLNSEGIDLINIVRRKQQVDIVKGVGGKYVLDSSAEGFQDELRALAAKLNTTICFDAIAGKTTGQILRCMPKKSTIEVYGGLSRENVSDVGIMDLLLQNKIVKGFMLPDWIASKNMLSLLKTVYSVKGLVKEELKSEIAKEVGLQQFEEGVKYYIANMTKGKVLLKPWKGIEEEKK